MSHDELHHVVIVGGGFGGLQAARSLRNAPVRITLIDRTNFHLFQPLLYQVASGSLSPGDIAAPLRAIFKRQTNVRTLMCEVTDIDPARRTVSTNEGRLNYDSLIVAAGAENQYFGNDDWKRYAPGLKTVEDALTIRNRIFDAFERAEKEPDPERQRRLLTFVVVGGGHTGVELAGALGEISRYTLKHDFRRIDPTSAKIYLLEGSDRILGAMPESLSVKATRSLNRLGVTVRPLSIVKSVNSRGVDVERVGQLEHIDTETVIWAAGIKGTDLGRAITRHDSSLLDRTGRVRVKPDLTLPGFSDVFVVGDLASFSHQTGKPLAAIAPVAMSQARYAAKQIQARVEGKPSGKPYHYFNRGLLATIGRASAVAHFGPLRFSGYFAWLLWLGVHLLQLVEFDNRLMVLVQWAWNYVTWNRGARIITK